MVLNFYGSLSSETIVVSESGLYYSLVVSPNSCGILVSGHCRRMLPRREELQDCPQSLRRLLSCKHLHNITRGRIVDVGLGLWCRRVAQG